MKSSEIWIKKLGLTPHPEGGYFKEVYRSNEAIPNTALPERYSGNRAYATSIYFLLEGNQFSAWHILQSDEIWYFSCGSHLYIHIMDNNGNYTKHSLGTDIEKGEEPQIIIPKQSWFAAEVANKESYSLVSCAVAPGFDFADFELGSKEDLKKQFPQHKEIINKFAIR